MKGKSGASNGVDDTAHGPMSTKDEEQFTNGPDGEQAFKPAAPYEEENKSAFRIGQGAKHFHSSTTLKVTFSWDNHYSCH